MVESQDLRHHAAHRSTNHVGPVDPVLVEDSQGVVGQVVEGVAHVGRDLGRQATVPVVIANYPEAVVHQGTDEFRRPSGAVGVGTGYQQDGGVPRRPVRSRIEDLGEQLDALRCRGVGHRPRVTPAT